MSKDPFDNGLTMLGATLTLSDAAGTTVKLYTTKRRQAPGENARSLWETLSPQWGGDAGLRATFIATGATGGVFLLKGTVFEEEDPDRILALPHDIQMLFKELNLEVQEEFNDINDPGAFYEMLYED